MNMLHRWGMRMAGCNGGMHISNKSAAVGSGSSTQWVDVIF